MKDERIITRRMETPPTRWTDEDEGYVLWKELGKLILLILVLLGLIWRLG